VAGLSASRLNSPEFFCRYSNIVENPGEGVPEISAKIPRRGSRLSGKIVRGVRPPILGFIAFLFTSVLKFVPNLTSPHCPCVFE
jgi:hypothetical protein